MESTPRSGDIPENSITDSSPPLKALIENNSENLSSVTTGVKRKINEDSDKPLIIDEPPVKISNLEQRENEIENWKDLYVQDLPQELLLKCTSKECSLCGVFISSSVVAKDHYSGKPHSKKVEQYLLDWSNSSGLPRPTKKSELDMKLWNDNFCDICKAILASPAVAESHYMGSKHARKAGLISKPKRSIESSTFMVDNNPDNLDYDLIENGNYCIACKTNLYTETTLKSHLRGKIHKSKALFFRNNFGSLEKMDLYCDICRVMTNCKEALEAHIAGKKHSKMLNNIQKNSAEVVEVMKNNNLNS